MVAARNLVFFLGFFRFKAGDIRNLTVVTTQNFEVDFSRNQSEQAFSGRIYRRNR